MKSTIAQIATYIERDGGKIVRFENGEAVVEVPFSSGGHVTYKVPSDLLPELDRERDLVYARLQAKKRAAAAR